MTGGRSRRLTASRLRWGIMAFASAAGIVMIAGFASEVRAALTYEVTLGAGAQVNDNLYLDPAQPVKADGRLPVQETVYTLSPSLTLLWQEERDRLQLLYNGEYWMFQGDENLDPLWVNNFAANLSWRRWSPFFLEVKDLQDRVPQTQQLVDTAVVDMINRNELTVRTGLAHDLGSRGTVELAYRGELVAFPGAGAADRVVSHYGEGLYRYRWTPLVTSEMRAAYGQVNRELSPDYNEMSVAAVVDQRLSERLSLRYGLEWIRDHQDASAAGETTAKWAASTHDDLLITAEIRGDFSRGGYWNIAYQDRQEPRSDGDMLEAGRASARLAPRSRLGSSLDIEGWYEDRDYLYSGRLEKAWGPTLVSRWMVSPWAAVDVRAEWTHTDIQDVGLPAAENRETRASAGIAVLLFRHLQLEGGYQFRENDSTDPAQSYTNNLFYAALTYSFDPIPPGRLLPSQISQVPVSSVAASSGSGTQGTVGGAATGR